MSEPLEEFYFRLKKFSPLPLWKPKDDPTAGVPEGMTMCACKKKVMPLAEIKFHNTGLVVATDIQCNECRAECRNWALIVCITCQAVVSKLAPQVFKGGFKLEANKCYHVGSCPKCKPDLEKSYLIEKYNHDKAQGMPVPDLG